MCPNQLNLFVLKSIVDQSANCFGGVAVSLTRRFEGRLWMLPSRIYSDVLVLSPGDPLEARELARRLDRSGRR